MAKTITITLTPEEADAVDCILGHALDQAHDTMERDYLQMLVDGGNDDFDPTEEREGALEETVNVVLSKMIEAGKEYPDNTPAGEPGP